MGFHAIQGSAELLFCLNACSGGLQWKIVLDLMCLPAQSAQVISLVSNNPLFCFGGFYPMPGPSRVWSHIL